MEEAAKIVFGSDVQAKPVYALRFSSNDSKRASSHSEIRMAVTDFLKRKS